MIKVKIKKIIIIILKVKNYSNQKYLIIIFETYSKMTTSKELNLARKSLVASLGENAKM